MTYESDRAWADSYEAEAIRVLRANAMHLIDIQRASDEDDRKHATDMIIRVAGGDVAVRIRRSAAARYSDLTIRSWRQSGAKTELAKIREGFARWYLYGWDDTASGYLNRWMLLDVDVLRGSGLLDSAPQTVNHDGQTAFRTIAAGSLQLCGCIIASNGIPLPDRLFA